MKQVKNSRLYKEIKQNNWTNNLYNNQTSKKMYENIFKCILNIYWINWLLIEQMNKFINKYMTKYIYLKKKLESVWEVIRSLN